MLQWDEIGIFSRGEVDSHDLCGALPAGDIDAAPPGVEYDLIGMIKSFRQCERIMWRGFRIVAKEPAWLAAEGSPENLPLGKY